MKAHVSSILLGVQDMDRSKRFYTEGLGWEVQSDYKISVFFVPHGGSLIGFYGRDGLADMVGVSPAGSGFSGVVFNYVVRSQDRVDEVLDEAENAGGKILKPAAKLQWGGDGGFLARPGGVNLENRPHAPGKGPTLAEERARGGPRAAGGAVAASLGCRGAGFATAPGPVKLVPCGRRASPGTPACLPGGTGTHRLMLDRDAGPFTGPGRGRVGRRAAGSRSAQRDCAA